jgi:uncharacterized protein YcbK (DUF882 family)
MSRMRRFETMALALILVVAFSWSEASVALAQADGEDSSDEMPQPAEESASSATSAVSDEPASSAAAKRKAGKQKRRRKSKVSGHVVPDSQLRTVALPRPSGRLHLYSLALKEAADVKLFNDDASYDVDELHLADRILRCKRTDTERPFPPRLVNILSHVYDHFGRRIDIVSGYRNQRKQTSYHFKGSAIDIRIEGVAPKKIVEFVSTLDTGGMGIGLYPRGQFVHIDVRPPPSYRWVDFSPPNGNAPSKRPPRGWKRKKLQS